MSDFDDHELRDALRRRAGAPLDGLGVDAAHSSVVARARVVRRRRAALAGGVSMAGLVAAAVFVIGPGRDGVVRNPADETGETDQSPDGTIDVTAGPTAPARTTAPPATTVPTAPAGPATTPVPSATAPTTTPAASVAPAPAPTTSEPAPTTSTTSTTAPTAPTTPTSTVASGPAPFTETYTSAGGSITVAWDGAALSLVATTPAAGFDAEVEDQRDDRIRVRFAGEGGDVRIEIRFQDGQVVRVE